MRIYLSGPMGAGKSTVGRALARRTGRPFVDLDARIVERAGKSIAVLFAEEGEQAFRKREREEALRTMTEADAEAVIALGGGTVVNDETRRAVLADGIVVTLLAQADTLTARVAAQTGRPLLFGGEAREALSGLLHERRAAYAECHAVVHTDDAEPETIAELIQKVEADPPVVVALGERTYRVEIGSGVRGRLFARAASASIGDVVVVTDESVRAPWADEVITSLTDGGRRVTTVTLPAGESAKHIGAVEQIWDVALSFGIDRTSMVLAVGGGVVGDLAGFAAATLLRGVAFGQMPTTLLSMVDASVGGKNGFDRKEGKNLVGAFHQPAFVLCDIEVLRTLPRAERVAGLAEVVKSAWLCGEAAVSALEADAAALAAGDPAATIRSIRMAVQLKAGIVAEDEREGSRRRLLNLGHTIGHAFEAAEGYGALRHGDAVALGMVAAFRVARALGRGEEAHEMRCVRLLEALGLPVGIDGRGTAEVLALIGNDKKREGKRVRFIAPGAPGDVDVVPIELERLRQWVALL